MHPVSSQKPQAHAHAQLATPKKASQKRQTETICKTSSKKKEDKLAINVVETFAMRLPTDI
jgi:hypothetical protein